MAAVSRLHDVENVEAFCSSRIQTALARNGGYLRPDQREELHRFLVVTAYELAAGFRPGLVTFERYAGWLLERRVNDWYRHTLGDSRSRARPQAVSIDTFAGADHLPAALTVRSHEDESLTRVAVS